MIDKIKNLIWSIEWEFEHLTKSSKIILGVINFVWLVVFYFIGIPGHKSILTYAVGLVVVEVVFILVAYFVKTRIIDQV